MSTASPASWALDARAKLKRYASGPVGDALRKAIPVLSPRTPVAAWCGVAANGSPDENTTGWKRCDALEIAKAEREGVTPLGRALDAYARTGLHELGPLGVEAGHAPGVVGPGGSSWRVGANDRGVVKVLGRMAAVDPGAWFGAVEDQVVVGVWNNARHGGAVLPRLDTRLRWEITASGDPKAWTLWPFFCATSAWSAGDGGAAKHLNRYADQLAAVPERLRVGAFLRLASTYEGGGTKHARPSYTGLRWAQKHAAAVEAVKYTGEAWALEWLDDGLGSDRDLVHAALVRSAQP